MQQFSKVIFGVSEEELERFECHMVVGLESSRNDGLNLSIGEYIGSVDEDECEHTEDATVWIKKDNVKKLISALQEYLKLSGN